MAALGRLQTSEDSNSPNSRLRVKSGLLHLNSAVVVVIQLRPLPRSLRQINIANLTTCQVWIFVTENPMKIRRKKLSLYRGCINPLKQHEDIRVTRADLELLRSMLRNRMGPNRLSCAEGSQQERD